MNDCIKVTFGDTPTGGTDPNTTTAVDDSGFSLDPGGTINIDALANDTDAEGDTQTICDIAGTAVAPGDGQVVNIDVSGNTIGTATLLADGTIDFTADASAPAGTYSFPYSVCDDGTPQATDTADITVEILGCTSATVSALFNFTENTTHTDHPRNYTFADLSTGSPASIDLIYENADNAALNQSLIGAAAGSTLDADIEHHTNSKITLRAYDASNCTDALILYGFSGTSEGTYGHDEYPQYTVFPAPPASGTGIDVGLEMGDNDVLTPNTLYVNPLMFIRNGDLANLTVTIMNSTTGDGGVVYNAATFQGILVNGDNPLFPSGFSTGDGLDISISVTDTNGNTDSISDSTIVVEPQP